MGRSYLRPTGLVFGPDAARLIKAGLAASLGGMAQLGFTGACRIKRGKKGIERKDVSLDKALAKEPDLMAAIAAPRGAFAGLDLSRTRIMGIVNVTPDSFSDGGQNAEALAAVAHGKTLAAEGAQILDVGGESTRPGSDPVTAEEELRRVVPVVRGLAAGGFCVSIDTRKAKVMTAAVAAGAAIINDVSALGHDPAALATAARLARPVVLMHAQGDPRTMQLNPSYEDVALDVYDALADRVVACQRAGMARQLLCVDPGIGFGKSFAHNLEVLQQLALFHGLGLPVLVGLSRKGFVGAVTGEAAAARRLHGSVAGALQAAMNGCHILRVHDVAPTRQALALFEAANGMPVETR